MLLVGGISSTRQRSNRLDQQQVTESLEGEMRYSILSIAEDQRTTQRPQQTDNRKLASVTPQQVATNEEKRQINHVQQDPGFS
nr:hypothetical protein [Dyella sp. ASV24]